MKPVLMLLSFASLYAIGCEGQSLKIGDTIPSLHLTEKWSGNKKISLHQNQLLLLDFWGTWCAPCIGVFPKLQHFKDTYEKDGLLVATLTDEKPEKVAQFFAKPRYANFTFGKWVDSTEAGTKEGITFRRLGITTVPFSLILDAQNRIRWVGTTHQLEDSTLNALLSRKSFETEPSQQNKPGLSYPALQPFDTIRKDGFTITARLVYKKSNNGMFNNFPEKGPVNNSFKGMPLNKLLQHFYRVSPAQVQVRVPEGMTVPLLAYQIRRDSGSSWPELAATTNNVLSKKLGYRYRVENKKAEVWVMEVRDETRLRKEAAPFDSTTGKSNQGFLGEDVITRNYSLTALKQLLEKQYEEQIFEWKPIAAALQPSLFDFEIPIRNEKALVKRLYNYGIAIRKETKQVPFVVVELN